MYPSSISPFISHADEDRELAGKLKTALSSYMLDGFVAHDDLSGGEDWRKALIDEIGKCDIFLILLTQHYHKANFTDHEAGIAICLDKPILPISLDGTVPYGLIDRYQSLKGVKGLTKSVIQNIASRIYDLVSKDDAVNRLISLFPKVWTFDQANRLADLLYEYRDELSKEQVNKIIDAFFSNSQLQQGYTSKGIVYTIYLSQKDKITSNNLVLLRDTFGE